MFEVEELIGRYAVADRAVPHLRANFIASLDGAATVGGLSGGLNDEWDKQVFDTLRRLADVVIVGAGTVRSEGYGALQLDGDAAAWRREHGLAEHPRFAIVTGRLELDASGPVFAEAPVRPIVLTHAGAPADRRARLSEVADVLDCGEHSVRPDRLVEVLREQGLPQMLTEGGPTLFGSLIDAGVVDELCLTIAPLLASGASRRIATGGDETPQRMRMAHALPGGPMLFLRYLRS